MYFDLLWIEMTNSVYKNMSESSQTQYQNWEWEVVKLSASRRY